MTPEEFRKEIIPEGRRLYYFAFRLLNLREEAEDVVQDVMTKLWEERQRLRDYGNVAAWATTMTRNMCIDRLRKRKTLRIDDRDSQRLNETPGEESILKFEREEASMLVIKIISTLSEPYKSAIILRDVEGYSYEEAAEVLNTNVNALRTMLSRARNKVRVKLEKTYRYGTGEGKGIARQVL